MPYRKLPPVRLKRGQQPRPRPRLAGEMERLGEAYTEWQRVRHYAESTVAESQRNLRLFLAWAAERGVTAPGEVSSSVLERYQAALFHYRKDDGKPLSVFTQRGRLTSVRSFFRWLARQHHIPANPASELVIPKQPRVLKEALAVEEVEAVLAEPDVGDVLGLRDRSILELFYSTGIRRGELLRLKLYDLDRTRGTLHVREGKGKKDRLLPMGERALAWLEAYLARARPKLESGHDEGEVFLTEHGEAISPHHLTDLVRRYFRRAGITKRGGCHLLRHTMATLMLDGGADIRFIQEMLGHASLETTQVYTHVALGKLQQIHAATHPGSRLAPRERDPEAEDAEAARAEQARRDALGEAAEEDDGAR
jgi:integrase/recombinase XerD